jgi:transposase
MFGKIKEVKALGLNKAQAARRLEVDYKTITKYWDMTPAEYAEVSKGAEIRTKKVDKYKEQILEWIREYRDMSSSQIYDWLRERHNTLDFKERTLRLYVNKLRYEHNLPKILSVRQYDEVPEMPMGYQAQVDMGEIWLLRTDKTRVKVYCFAMVLAHSRYKYALWSDKPFTTQTFTDAHNKAFEYFGGMPIEIVYDQDKLAAVSENYGDIIFTEGFQNYVDTMKFKVYLCRKGDPESKGKIEAVVKYLKYNFADHRTFYDIDSFNDDCMKWLERTGNGKVHEVTKKIPAEVFKLEKQHLKPVPQIFEKINDSDSLTYIVRKNNTVLYKPNRYQVPKGTYAPGKRVKLQMENNEMDIVDIETGEIITHHKISMKKGELVRLSHPERDRDKSIDEVYNRAFQLLNETDNARILLDSIRKEKSRYAKDQFTLIINTVEKLDSAVIDGAVDYCVKKELWSAVFFRDTAEYLQLGKAEQKDNKAALSQISIPSKYHGIKPEIRSINDYINALREDETRWKN